MNREMYKCFFPWQYEDEERLLNEMSSNGLQFTAFSFPCKYTFTEGKPGEYIYRIELLNNVPSHADSVNYIAFLEDTGIKHICSYMRWAYFRKKAADGEFELYSDIDSRLKHYRRISLLLGVLCLLNMPNAFHIFEAASAWRMFSSVLSALAFIIMGLGFLSVARKIMRLKKEKMLRE
jgi:hypothetical protein